MTEITMTRKNLSFTKDFQRFGHSQVGKIETEVLDFILIFNINLIKPKWVELA